MSNLRECNRPEKGDRIFKKLIDIIHESSKIVPKSRHVKHFKPYWKKNLIDLRKTRCSGLRIEE